MIAKLIQFQVYNNTIYALDADGTLWKNLHPPTSNGWQPVPGPTRLQQTKEIDADKEREKRWDISK